MGKTVGWGTRRHCLGEEKWEGGGGGGSPVQLIPFERAAVAVGWTEERKEKKKGLGTLHKSQTQSNGIEFAKFGFQSN